MEPRQEKEIDFHNAGAKSAQNEESSEGFSITVDNEELLNVVVKSAIGGVASAWAVKSALGDK